LFGETQVQSESWFDIPPNPAKFPKVTMKTLTSLVVLIAVFSIHNVVNAQSARQLTRRIVSPNNTLITPNVPNPSAPATRPAPTAPPVAPQTRPTNIYVLPEKTQAQKDEILRKTIEFQKQRAAAGAPTAQYDLGMRYLNGDGVEKDPALAKKWLTAASTNGSSEAVKKLEELNKKEAAATK
jgi:hypothetical protein